MDIFGYTVDTPAMSLIVMALAIGWIMVHAARNPDSFWAAAFKDDAGKTSAMRLGTFVAMAVSGWLLIFVTSNVIKDGKDLAELLPFFIAYICIWTLPKTAETLVNIVAAKFGVKVGAQS